MFNHKRIAQSALLVFAILLYAPFVSAQPNQFDDGGFYVGGGYGLVTVDGGDFDDDDGGPHLFAGFQILPFLGIEAGYYDFGEYGSSALKAEVESYSLAVTGRLPLSNSFALFARVGPMWTETEFSAGGFSAESDSEELFVGVGLSFEIAENIDLRVAYDWVDADLDSNDLDGLGTGDFDADLNMLSAGIKFEF